MVCTWSLLCFPNCDTKWDLESLCLCSLYEKNIQQLLFIRKIPRGKLEPSLPVIKHRVKWYPQSTWERVLIIYSWSLKRDHLSATVQRSLSCMPGLPGEKVKNGRGAGQAWSELLCGAGAHPEKPLEPHLALKTAGHSGLAPLAASHGLFLAAYWLPA